MTLKVQHKRSAVKGKAPLPADLEYGEIAVNYEATDPALYIKDSADAIRKIGNQPAATETVAGIVELATAAETTTGTDATRAVHPAGLKVELDKKAPLASPALTGTPTAPTAAAGTNTTQLATTAFVTAAVTAEDLWDRTGTEISPKTAGDSVFTSGAMKVGGTTAAPNITLKADGSIHGAISGGIARFHVAPNGQTHVEHSTATTSNDFITRFWSNLGTRSEKAVILADGEFRIGPAGAPNIKLESRGYIDIQGSGTPGLHIKEVGGGNGSGNLLMNSNVLSLNADSSGSVIAFSCGGGTERARIGPFGDFLLGGTMPASPAITLSHDGNATLKGRNPFFTIQGTTAATRIAQADNTGAYLKNAAPGDTTFETATRVLIGNANANFGIALYANGNISYNGTLTPPSDAALKEGIVDADLDHQWDDIKRIQLRNYRWKAEPERGTMLGVIAQELETISPGLIVKDLDDDGNVVEGSCKVKVDALYMKMLGALQVAQQRIEALETRLAALEPAAPHKQADPGAK